MKHRVVWRKRVQDQLHTVAFLIRERGGITQHLKSAVRSIEAELQSDPNNAGESREDRERVLIHSPLTVWYEVFEQDGVVLIYDAVLYPRRRM